MHREGVTPVTLGVTFAKHQNIENWLKVELQKKTYRGLRNSEPVESEDISVLLVLRLQTETDPFATQGYFSYQGQMPQMQHNKKNGGSDDHEHCETGKE